MTAGTKRVRVVHAALKVFNSIEDYRFDAKQLLKLKPHVVLGTESGDQRHKLVLKDAFHNAGYETFLPHGTDAWIGVRSTFLRPGWHAACLDVLPSGKEAGDPHHYQAKGIVSLQWTHPQIGHFGCAVTHGPTLARHKGDAQRDKPGDPVDHYAASTKLMHALCDVGDQMTRGGGLAVISADTNLRDQDGDVFRGRGKDWVTVWDKLGVHPPTLEDSTSTIDVVAVKKADKRIKVRKAVALHDKIFPFKSDHYPVVVDLDITKLKG